MVWLVLAIEEPPVYINPCQPSPCGPNAQCKEINGSPSCSCFPEFIGSPPSCRPECVSNSECTSHLACISNKCKDPCPGACGQNAECKVISHTPNCICITGYTGNPFVVCQVIPIPIAVENVSPCTPSPCGANAECRVLNRAGACTCLSEYIGNPYEGCRPECTLNSDCSSDRACINNKCKDPCPGTCAQNAYCQVINHLPACSCNPGYTGDPFRYCNIPPEPVIPDIPQNPCQPSPCGPNSQCREVNKQAVCSCLPEYIGSPPGCRPECTVSSECAQNKACINQKCIDPCPGTCGLNANCKVINHSPICSCRVSYTGEPFTRCYPIPPLPPVPIMEPIRDPCVPSPCGPNSQCRNNGGSPSCSCLPQFVGSPPNCKPECTINSECPSNLACITQKCRDPCPGSCGVSAQCSVINHTPICTCIDGYNGDPFSYCLPKPPPPPEPVETDPCYPSPCGSNANCDIGICTCLPEYQGDPYKGCRPECVLNNDCPRDRACIKNKCIDPCPGTCGQNAECSVVNHIPICSCVYGYAGNAFVLCNPIPKPVLTNPCIPTPCGPNSQCREINGQAVCSCVPGYIGSPPTCRPQCITSAECALNKACVNQKCIDPCPGTCGRNAECQVVNHNPICSCLPNLIGDPFVLCTSKPLQEPVYTNPCQPSPCGPNSQCRDINGNPSCSCLIEFIGSPPSCRPECVSNSECASHLACINQKCKDPCPGVCGQNSECRVVSHTPNCVCLPSFVGNPFIACSAPQLPPPREIISPCSPSPCGANAVCKAQNNAGSCTCISDYVGNPYDGCRPECSVNSDCPSNKACINNKCKDPCPGACGQNAECQIRNHLPQCTCLPSYTGDPFRYCNIIQEVEEPPKPQNPCQPSPCGPNSQCKEINDQAVCSCLPNYIGSPPGCRPECTVSSECAQNKACINQKCSDPCPGTCGLNAQCHVINHSPICSCSPGHTGDPFTRCYSIPPPPPIQEVTEYVNPCVPSPCGPNSQCRDINQSPVCSCLPNYIGAPPNCKPECTINSECSTNLACIREKCRDPCPGSCGTNAQCTVITHTPICTCIQGYIGDAFSYCSPKPPSPPEPVDTDPCDPSPCGPNAQCNNGICKCLPEYQGDPYRGCRPECVLNNDCPKDKACIKLKCVDPCPGTCGQNAECAVINHIPMCSCTIGYTGNAFTFCSKISEIVPQNPCNPSPCGPNSQCREINGHAVCSCVPGFIGSSPTCRPECVRSSECSLNQACVNQKCIDPCPGTCGIGALCQVVNHNPICSCPSRQTGNPFDRCLLIQESTQPPLNPCQPSPCGAYAECKVINDQASCSCLATYIGVPPNCRPECVSNSECAFNLACINQKCKDPCPNVCGSNAGCRVVSHTPDCFCLSGFTGNPFISCSVVPPPPPEPVNPCVPSPCGANAVCREQNGAGSCTCLPEYIGNPYEGCRPECVLNSDCPSNKACIANKCKDPCPGTCGQNAECSVINHLPNCNCLPGYTGDPFRYCNLPPPEPVTEEPTNPCQPSPCGPNSQCREVNDQAVCSCLPEYIGSPPNCRPECVVSSECPLTKACINQKCTDPCPGTCGLNAKCSVINHSPICSCSPGHTGDPFTRCYPLPPPPPEPIRPIEVNPCVPSPCGPNAECTNVGGSAVCRCLSNYFGNPPNCRPECTINQECSSNLACIRQKCTDPCPGSCGFGAQCSVINHTPICTCPEGYTGDPFTNCVPKPPPPPETVETDPCNPSPCGSNAQCSNGICTCLPEYQGDPYRGCRPECVLNNDCPWNKACIKNKCVDPCPGTCGTNAECAVVNHIPMCTCQTGYIGNAFVLCSPIPVPIPQNPCNPSPCGPNSQCREINAQAVCSCVPGFIGSPPTCRPECVTSSECSLNQACINQKCIDPCPGTCGINALCQVVNHNPICSCAPRHSGDPFIRCIPIRDEPIEVKNPCNPSPCGPNAQCREINGSPSCSCLPEFIGQPPNCKPECISNSECPNHLACINQKCKDPCPGTCGQNAECRVVSHTPNCVCFPGFIGDPFSICSLQVTQIPVEQPTPCLPSPCGANAICREQNGAGSCSCLPEYIGNPYEGCRPECSINSDCPSNKACIRNKCVDPCPGTCGQNAECQVVNHLPSCTCLPLYTGDPFRYCNLIPPEPIKGEIPQNPCQPSPCGPNSQCREVNGQAVCSCLAEYIGSPPGCRPECVVSTECPQNKACINQKCVDPCPGTCGLNANCQVINHSPICSCSTGYTGDPFTRCYLLPPPPPEPQPKPQNPCVPSPCGPNSQCRDVAGAPSCSCLPTYLGTPPNCRPECTINPECPSNQACMQQKCRDPCPGSCGTNAQCSVINHTPICICIDGYTGDPFTYCSLKPPPPPEPVETDPCIPSPCGSNAQCNNGICTCLPEYQGDPYRGCRPECVLNDDCPRDRACIRNKCQDPCPGTCGQNAECSVINHIPICSCISGFIGNAFVICSPIPVEIPKNPCQPSPCGPNSQCREINGQAVCSCVPGFIGSPPACRPECVTSSECSLNKACVNQKCIDPCPGTCGLNAQCQVVNHNPICSCLPGQTGDPFTRCLPIREEPVQVPQNPCQPNPCGPNAQCRPIGDAPSCSCIPEFTGTPPNCKPECISNSECAMHLACISQKCKDPCPGTCGINADCRVVSHTPNCVCLPGYNGNPFIECILKIEQPIQERPTPCIPSPCGANAICREQNGAGACQCIADYIGNPYEGCRPECTLNSDCPSNKACISNKCKDPCPGSCGSNAECQVINHLPSCTCIVGYTGDPFRYCTFIQEVEPVKEPTNPCQPSPCGANSQCREVNGQAVCSCLPEYIGSPPGCRPECVVSSECPTDKACVNKKCVDPCPGTCGLNAKCQVVNHSPICSCSSGFTGDPFTRCYTIPAPPPEPERPIIKNPCVPSPCGPNSQCRDIGNLPSCSCLRDFIGAPPNCRPECTINSECPTNQACIQQKCRDPCPGLCGTGAQCSTFNHIPICSCLEGYTGDPFSYCQPKPPELPVVEEDPCNPSPCGANAQCNNGVCTCLPEYQGDAYVGCRPECVLNNDCSRDKTCIRQKCVDPCPGTCGQNAECSVINHIPSCSCLPGYQGNAFVACQPIPPEIPKNPCHPSPCGPNSQCREINSQAVCSCVPGFIGSPPACRPECVSSNECQLDKACVNQKCIDPCPGTCGISALCQVVNHNPICSCPNRYSGDPFTRCSPIVEIPGPPVDPCYPSPCGPNSQCRDINGSPSCSCLPEFTGQPPNCRPECVSNSECANHLACINQKCKDPCPGTCGQNAECRVVSHTPNCICIQGYVGNPFVQCNVLEAPKPIEQINPCYPTPCGANAICREQNNAGSCTCIQDYLGNPYEGCRPECTLNSDCPSNKACVRNKCVDPCPGTCGQNAECQVINHLPSCNCVPGYTGDPFRYCHVIQEPIVEEPLTNPCQPSPCGPNSQCREVNKQAVCSCLPNFFGSPPGCRPECTVSSECAQNKACINQKCVDPCPGICGLNAQCNVVNHSPICACSPGHIGDPFTRCYPTPPPPPEPIEPVIRNPCMPSPCGPHSICQDINSAPSCSCISNYIGYPPNCRPECTINSECISRFACIREKCLDPCPGSCGFGAQCSVINHTPICTCPEGYTGDPFTSCHPKPAPPPVSEKTHPCNPSPCGPNAQCNNGICTCIAEYQGDPYVGCRPECVLNTDCARDKACINKKCRDPCLGTCEPNAKCAINNHIPSCSCKEGFTGDPYVLCLRIAPDLPKNPCNPSPCGPNSQCREINGQSVCACVVGYIGSPPTCRPECITSTECPLNQACLNQKCIDPCPGTCGLNALCQVINHNPICSCSPRQTGDPFIRCVAIEEPIIISTNPCNPSPCGPNSQCRDINGSPSCSCLLEFTGQPPNCRPECVSNSECANHLACINQKCKDPCPGTCGENSECRVVSHTPNCVCLSGYNGNPFQRCVVTEVIPRPPETTNPCVPSPCGTNAVCKEHRGAGSCTCLPEFIGNPYEGCRPECVLNSDCPSNKACINNKCTDPCPGTCGSNAECQVINHLPSCTCVAAYTGDPFRVCYRIPPRKEPIVTPSNPCQPSPCGPNSQCREVNDQAVCSCLPNYIGSPPGCRPECTVSSECAQNRACINQKCVDPCPGTCGLNAKCSVINHSPICSCSPSYTGDPFTRCYPIPPPPSTPPAIVFKNPCIPSPCGPNSQCRDIGGNPSCSCLQQYIGAPPNCRPECIVNSECPSNLACMNEKCRDPCPGSCGLGATCEVRNHSPVCVCPPGYIGDAFVACMPKPAPPPKARNPCNPNPCGTNAQCDNGTCSCYPEYQGDAYRECRPECVINTDCPRSKACINQKCGDPCQQVCGENTECTVYNHIPTCSCLPGYAGNAFVSCFKITVPPPPSNPCNPSPCGPNSQCRDINGQGVCSCIPGYIGAPPSCRPECVSSTECPLNQACLNQKCIDPCPGTCGIEAICQVVNHNPICSCPSRYSGDPFVRCRIIVVEERLPQPHQPKNPCIPSPCGPNAQCEPTPAETAKCSCLPNYFGVPPNCRPECVTNNDCSKNLACINQKCKDPCPGSCGLNARCLVVNHVPNCLCIEDYVGDPFTMCIPKPSPPPPTPEPRDPCYPSPCGPNARCRTENNYAICECLPEYHGNPYESCRPECLANSDCQSNRACIRNKCQDPCPGTCGVNALCTVTNHVPVCTCPEGYSGDAFRFCSVFIEPPQDPCNPSPCGINTICRTSGNTAICECLPGFFGNANAGGCRPECTVSSDCARDKACVNTKCVDPCPGVCGFKAICHVINHSPVCSCPPPLVGDPFTLCAEPVITEPQDPCNPSPCKANGQCRVVNGAASCIYPECIINPDCPRDKACYFQKCQDPCRGACGLNAICQVVNHQAVCTCPPGYIGTPEVQCRYQPPEQPKPKVECTQDSDCTNDKACINNRCQNPCSTASCGQNAECRAQLHRAVCICRDGFTGNAQHACVEIGCRTDSDCAPTHACVNKECVDPCSYTSCGINAFCRADSNHKARCYCPENFRGNPLVQCERPECTRDEECSYNLACRNERCQDPCNCGQNAICNVNNHRAQCSCPPGYIGNPLSVCNVEERVSQPECKMDSDCPSKLACFSGECKNPCVEIKPCGKNAECIVVDSLPLRTMSCICLPGFIGDADVDCKPVPEEEPGCKTNEDCSLSEVCINRQCVNPCVIGSPCAPTAECQASNHKALCKCPTPLIGNPFIRCYEEARLPKPECVHDAECPHDKSCINQRCQDPCLLSNPCGTNAECQTRIHRPTCVCPFGWVGNPQIMCYKPECKIDDDCPYNKACISENCINPCSTTSCGRGAECIVQNHYAQCQCPPGTQGDPLLSCITGQCQYNEDCADHEACDRLNRVCRPVCDDDTCAATAQCTGENHQPKCHCPIGQEGNPFVECKTPPRPECIVDADCPSQLACINELCQNPCHQGDYCSIEQECRVVDTLPLRTIMCVCPPDQIIDSSGHCRAIVREQPQCQVDNDCADAEKCYRGNCVNACRLDNCGVNAICRASHHLTQCSCAPGYTGNPRIECTNIPKVSYLPQPECTADNDCTNDKACRNDVCVNPCRSDKPCGSNAFCSVNRHQPVCRCPEGYEGRPEIECVAPSIIAVGCSANSDCPLSESCINKVCISPCNCGPNADCKVVNHYATCFCKAGYSGNPQTGCVKLGCQSDSECADDQQCYNTQCINPCILGDPCARNADCFGRNHKATCKCPAGYEGDPFVRCERLECYSNQDCPNTRACIQNRCVDPCSPVANPICAQNAICYAQNHAASCICPDHLPEGNSLAYCYPRIAIDKPICEYDSDCPSKLACIRNQCVNPCESISPCHSTAHCSVIDTIPVRTMACTCPEGWVPNDNGECHAILIPIPPGCSKDDDCPDTESCINRICRNPCDCGINAVCDVRNHKPICSCKEGFEGNPNIACRTIGCRIDSECDSGTACINAQCINPCLVKNPCGTNAECYVNQNRPECRCRSGFRGNPLERCLVVGCISNSECPADRQCINAQCINPCVFNNPCSPRAECLVQHHMALCKCPPGLIGNPYIDCRPEPQPECREDGDCSALLACINSKCQNPCTVIHPCQNPAKCQVVNSLPVRTMNCVCPPGYISSGSGTCNPVTAIVKIGACTTDSECPSDKACFNGICRNPCNCGPNAECRIKDHKPICSCKAEYEGNPEIECHVVGCRSDYECSPQHTCINRQCVPVCLPDGKPCGDKAVCYGVNHRAICDCPPGLIGNPQVACVLIGCRSDSECPSSKACINNKCENPCVTTNPCDSPAECKTFNHIMECVCPPGTVSDGKMGCLDIEEKCQQDHDCPSGHVCIGEKCVNPCTSIEPCGINAECTVIDTEPVRTMICECLPGYHGNAAVKCDRTPPIIQCRVEKGYIRTPNGECICPPNTALNENDDCVPCSIEKGLVIDERGRCVCALEKGLIIDERGNCVCPIEFGYRLDSKGNCIPVSGPECETNDDCPDHKYCNPNTKTCDNPCATKRCGVYALCNATNHRAICQCITGYVGNPEVYCNSTSTYRTDFPKPDMVVSCLSDGVQVEIVVNEQEGFNGVLYVKGHSKDEQCRRVLTLPPNSNFKTELFKVQFGNCGLIHVNGKASFVLVIQKHPKLVTYKAQAYHIQCVYQTGEQNVTLGFNVSMLTTAGTIANTGPPPTCLMKIVTSTGQEINSAEIGDSLILQVDVQPGSIYGGFARSCVAKTMEDSVENEYLVTDENGCATDPSIFGEWEYNPDTQSLLATFNAFKFPSSDNIRFQCNIRVCFGKCQPVNCRGYNAFGRRKRAIAQENDTNDSDDLLTGQLREEITIQSNAILTLERREERYTDASLSPDAQRTEDICVSMIGFIIALIITALLALVAVAVAVSCWLMAYRRRPKSTGPLPHPPEFPNPLFTTPEPMAEPSPDYLT